MDPITGLFIGTTLFSAFGAVRAGRAQRDAARIDAMRYETRRLQALTESSERARLRQQEFEDTESLNLASIAASGLALPGFDALMERNRERAARDEQSIVRTGQARALGLGADAASARVAGASAAAAGTVRAISLLGEGALKYSLYRRP